MSGGHIEIDGCNNCVSSAACSDGIRVGWPSGSANKGGVHRRSSTLCKLSEALFPAIELTVGAY